jgi:integrase
MPRVARGHVEQLPSGSWRARVYAGVDPITQREIRLKATVKTEQQAHIELGRLLKEASEGRTPESDATVAKLMDEYAAIAPWDVSTRQTNEVSSAALSSPLWGTSRCGRSAAPSSTSCTRD